MNKNWKKFLLSQNAEISAQGEIIFPIVEDTIKDRVFPISGLSILAVNGSDAALFLQGQSTCNIKEVTESKGSFGAFCTPKGKTISTFFIIRQNESFLVILPSELLEKIKKKLQFYILRSDVNLAKIDDECCLFGLTRSGSAELGQDFPAQLFKASSKHDIKKIRFPGAGHRFLMFGPVQSAIDFWTELTEDQKFKSANSSDWSYLDMVCGIPWLNMETTEEFIPQMINLDQLQGISFNKGCYTGQEIIARTHYLGKPKRKMYLAETFSNAAIPSGVSIIDHEAVQLQSIGKVLKSCQKNGQIKMLVVLQIANADSKDLRIENQNQDKIKISELSY